MEKTEKMKWFEDSESVLLKDIFGKKISIKAIVFMNKGRGDFGVFLCDYEGKEISFITGANVIIGNVLKLFANFGIRPDYELIIRFPARWDIIMLQKRSKNGFFYVDFQGI